MMEVTAVGRSDVGRTRHGKANEDSFHVGDSAFAVADGMGGHLAGEVASSLALRPVTNLDGRVYSDSTEALTALRDAVAKANRAVIAKATSDAQFQGMGTTLTAVVVEGRRAHIAHVGDSRAYLLRDGVFSQLTTDHTLVQRLVDDGRITEREAEHHPHRSVITRAIGVEDHVDIDAMTLDLVDGDRLLLCSDGLSGPVSDEAMAKILSSDELDRVPDDLIDAANDAGGPDNITAVILGVTEVGVPGVADDGDATGPLKPVVVRTVDETSQNDWATSLGRIGNLSPDHDGATTTGRRTTTTTIVVLMLVAALLGGGFVLGRSLLQRSWYVGVADDEVVTIYQGLPVEIGSVRLSWAHEPTDWTIDEVPELVRDNVRDGMAAQDLEDARLIVENFDRLRATRVPVSPSPAPNSPAPSAESNPSPARSAPSGSPTEAPTADASEPGQ